MLDELTNEERAERITTLIRHIGGLKAALAEDIGVSPQAITGWEKTGRIGRRAAAYLCRRAGYPSEYLLVRNWKGRKEEAEDWPEVMGFKVAAALGDGAVPDEYAQTHKLKFRASSLRRRGLVPDKLGIVYGRGDSMFPRIRDGDAIMFDRTQREPVDGALFVVTYDGNLLAKQLVKLGGRWFIDSLNKDDPKWRKPQPVDEHSGFEIHGRVVWIGSWED